MGSLNQELKSLIEEFTFLSRDVLHVYGGMFAFLSWLIIFKYKKRILGLLLIFVAAVINEVLDGFYYFEQSGRIHWAESISDIFNTVFTPLIFYFFLHHFFDKRHSI